MYKLYKCKYYTDILSTRVNPRAGFVILFHGVIKPIEIILFYFLILESNNTICDFLRKTVVILLPYSRRNIYIYITGRLCYMLWQ